MSFCATFLCVLVFSIFAVFSVVTVITPESCGFLWIAVNFCGYSVVSGLSGLARSSHTLP